MTIEIVFWVLVAGVLAIVFLLAMLAKHTFEAFEIADDRNIKRHENIVAQLKHITMTQAELAAGLKTLQTQVGKVAKEQSDRFDVLSKEIQDLKDIIAAGGDVTPEVTQALADVSTALQSLDDVVPDAPPTP